MKNSLRSMLLLLPLGMIAWAGCGGGTVKVEPVKGPPPPSAENLAAPPPVDLGPGTPPGGSGVPGTGTTPPGTGTTPPGTGS